MSVYGVAKVYNKWIEKVQKAAKQPDPVNDIDGIGNLDRAVTVRTATDPYLP